MLDKISQLPVGNNWGICRLVFCFCLQLSEEGNYFGIEGGAE